MLVDGESRPLAHYGKDLGSAAGRGQQHSMELEVLQRIHYGRKRGGLTRTRISVHHHYIGVVPGKEGRNAVQERILAGGELVGETAQEFFIEKIAAVHLSFLTGEEQRRNGKDGIDFHAPHEHIDGI